MFEEMLERLFKVIFPGKERVACKEERNSCGWLSPGSPLQQCPGGVTRAGRGTSGQ